MLDKVTLDVINMTSTDGYGGCDNLSGLLTTDEVLGYLKVTSRTIYRLIRIGELPAVRIGRQWRIRRVDLDRWLDRQRSTIA